MLEMEKKQSTVYKVLHDDDGTPGFHKLADFRPSVLFGFIILFCSWVCIILALPVGLDNVLGSAFSAPCTDPVAALAGYPGCLTASNFVGLLMVILFSFLGLLLVGYSIIVFMRAKSVWRWVGLIWAVNTLIAPAIALMVQYVQPANTTTPIDGLQQILGIYYFTASAAMTISCFVIFCKLFIQNTVSYPSALAPAYLAPGSPMHGPRSVMQEPLLLSGDATRQSPTLEATASADAYAYGRNVFCYLLNTLVLLGFIGGLIAMTGFMPALWGKPLHTVLGYWASWSPYAYNVVINSSLIWKSYPDVVAYFSFLSFIVVVSTLSLLIPRVRRIVHYRIRLHSPTAPFFINVFPHGICVGEICLIAAVMGLYAFWFWYFRFDFDYFANTINLFDPRPLIAIYARVFGHLTNLSMSFLILPATRNSLWHGLFGIPFERMIKYHRAFGALTYTFATTHMLIWFVSWGMAGNLKNNLFTLTQVTFYNTDPVTTGSIHFDNFSIALMQLGWILLTVTLAFAWLRRSNWELFRISHNFAFIFLLFALIHAWANWYYTGGGLMLWLFDRCIRLVRSSTASAELISAEHAHGVTRLVFQNPTFRASPGQYVYLNFPQISGYEWHPFSVSSCGTSTISFHIKSMGPGTFTQQLADYVTAFPILAQSALISPAGKLSHDEMDNSLNSQPFTVYMDGPYGQFADLTDQNGLLLIAGGIGCTPLMSVVGDLHQKFVAAQSGVQLPHALQQIRLVHLVFASRDLSTLYAFAPLLAAIRSNHVNSTFRISLFCSRHSDAQNSENNPSSYTDVTSSAIQAIAPSIHHGRPDFDSIFSEFSEAVGHSGLVAVCGPTTMINGASESAFRHNLDFHSEAFEI